MDEISSNYLVMFLRFLTSASVARGKELFECYMEEGKTVDQFRRQDVENLDVDADNVRNRVIRFK